jgi:hypothetical protein
VPSERSDTKKRTGIRILAAWLAAGLLLLALIPALSRFVETSAQWLPYPYPRAGSEGLILYESLLVKRGGDIYAPITPERFISGPYPPIYYWLGAQLLPETLPDFSSTSTVSSIFTSGRLLSLVAALIVAALLPLLVIFDRHFPFVGPYPSAGPYSSDASGHRRRALLLTAAGGLVGGLIFLTLPQTVVWATRFRGDMLMLALTAAGLVCVAIGG